MLDAVQAANPQPMGSYADAWRDYRRLWRWSLVTSLGGFLAMALFLRFAAASVLSVVIGVILGGLWVAAFLVTGFRFAWWPCPRCG